VIAHDPGPTDPTRRFDLAAGPTRRHVCRADGHGKYGHVCQCPCGLRPDGSRANPHRR
jgi:hypothetical protein